MKCLTVILLLVHAVVASVHARQPDTVRNQIQNQLEEGLEEVDDQEALSGEQLIQFLEDLAKNPMNLNRARITDLLQVPGVNLKLARAILEYRRQKPFEAKEELLKVPGLGEATYKRLSPYVMVGDAGSRFRELYTRPEYWLDGKETELISRYQQTLSKQRGYQIPDSLGGYLGSPIKYYQRLRFSSRHLSLNLTQEKDAGEPLSGPQGFDFNSFHLALKDNGKLKDLVLGDYSLSFGQGLVLWSGGAFGKGREVVGAVGKNERGLRAYASSQETDFFRGVAVSYGEKAELTAFYSSRPRTASVIEGDTVRFPSTSGFHRTLNEVERKNNIDQQVIGGRVRADTPFGLIGATGYVNRFNRTIRSNDIYDFSGTESSVLGVDYRALVGSALVFGEVARSKNGGYAGITGLETRVGGATELTMSYRKFSKDFQSFLGDGFGESSSGPQNEEGFYLGLRYGLSDKLKLSAYADQYFFEFARTGNNQPGRGTDYLGLIEFTYNRDLSAYLLLRKEIKDADYSLRDESGRETKLLGSTDRSSGRLQVEYFPEPRVRLRSRVEGVQFQQSDGGREFGLLIFQDVRAQLTPRIRLDGRITIFETESFDSRVYQFENDLLYVLSNTALSGRGQRMYVVIKYELSHMMDLWVKYASSLYEDERLLSSGLNEIQGNRNNALGIQLRVRWHPKD